MKIAILICDDVLDKFQPRFGQYRDMIRQMFAFLDRPLAFADFDCRQGHYPRDIDDYDFYITTGSKASVYDNAAWIQELIQFVQHLDSHRKKLIGICFGHQIIAMARRGMVEKSPKGWGVGVAVNRVVATPDWMGEKRPKLNIIASHHGPTGALVHVAGVG